MNATPACQKCHKAAMNQINATDSQGEWVRRYFLCDACFSADIAMLDEDMKKGADE